MTARSDEPRPALLQLATRISTAAARCAAEPLARAASAWLPTAADRAALRIQRDLPYHPGGHPAHRLDLVQRRDAAPPRGTVLYLHGGGFRMLSKTTHGMMLLPFARAGLQVVSIDYRLAPRYPFPAALLDCCRALRWLVDHAGVLGVPPERLIFAGESAGANLALSLTLLACCRREEPWARELFDLGVRPRGLIAQYGLLQTSDPGRFRRAKPRLPRWLHEHLAEISAAYRAVDPRLPRSTLALADPLVWLEQLAETDRPLPGCFAAVGTRDPLLPDTRRLEAAYRRLGVPCDIRYVPGRMHGFNAWWWTPAARQCWADTLAFVDRALTDGAAGPRPAAR